MDKDLEERFYQYVGMFEKGNFSLYYTAWAFTRSNGLPISELKEAEKDGIKYLSNLPYSNTIPDRITKNGNPVFEVKF